MTILQFFKMLAEGIGWITIGLSVMLFLIMVSTPIVFGKVKGGGHGR